MFLASCTNPKQEKSTLKYVDDPHSYAQPDKAVITHLDLDIDVDFNSEIIEGKATYKIENNNSSEIILDSKFLEIEKIQADGEDTEFSLGEFDELLGQSLKITISKETKKITVFYKTTNKTEALQWLNPLQTTHKLYPFLYTQGWPILTRTWIPIQDSPQIRITYNATVRVPSELMAVMSAENPKKNNEKGEYKFKMQQPIPAYLIALAVGDIEYKAVSKRTGIYAEKSMVDKVQYEFSDMEKMVSTAESLYGEYAWEEYDVIVLPPSFPYGGMENPRLTFITPTLIAGDKSLTSLIAHELAHSWSGNLVTNATWDDFWLNEGFTTYFELRIMEALYGKDRANMLAFIYKHKLDAELENLKDTPDATKLKLNLNGRNPDDALNWIPYVKGYQLLRTLEETVGREKFDEFLRLYFQKYAFSTMTTEKFVIYLNENLLVKNEITFNTDDWIYKQGLPDNQAIIESDRFDNVEKVLNQFMENDTVKKDATNNWTTDEWTHFINSFPSDIGIEHLAKFDEAFDFTNSTNSYIAMVWYEQAINHDYHGNNVDARIENFLINIGRREYVSTIYQAYRRNGKIEEALKIYKKARPNYHPLIANTIDELLDYQK